MKTVLKRFKIPLIWIAVVVVGSHVVASSYPDMDKQNPRLAMTFGLAILALLTIPMFWITVAIAKHFMSPHSEANIPPSQKRAGFITKKK